MVNYESLGFPFFFPLQIFIGCAIIIVIMATDDLVMDKDMNHGALWPMTFIMTYVLKKHESFTMQHAKDSKMLETRIKRFVRMRHT